MKLTHEKIKKRYSFVKRSGVKSDDICNKGIGLHWHSNIEMCRIIDGKCDFNVGGNKFTADKGDVIFVNSGEFHSIDINYGTYEIYICTFNPSLLFNVLGNVGVISTHIRYDRMKELGIDEEISSLFDSLYDEIGGKDKYSNILFQANLIKIYGLFLRYFEDASYDERDATKIISFQKIIEYISESFSENITLESVANRFNYNPTYVSRLFKTRTGVNFKNYLDNIRVQNAIEMLIKTDMTVSSISIICGYENIRTFNSVFKKVVGVTPSSIRKKK